MLSRKAKYALKALRLMALAGEDPQRAEDLANAEGIPRKFLEQALAQLRRHGVLTSRPGPGGGYLLARPATEIPLGRIVRLLDGPLAPLPCASETAYRPCDECEDIEGCGIRIVMRRVRDATAAILDGTSLEEFAYLPGRRRHKPGPKPGQKRGRKP